MSACKQCGGSGSISGAAHGGMREQLACDCAFCIFEDCDQERDGAGPYCAGHREQEARIAADQSSALAREIEAQKQVIASMASREGWTAGGTYDRDWKKALARAKQSLRRMERAAQLAKAAQ